MKPLFFLLLFFVISRLIVVSQIPLFHDEAIYIHWAQWVADDWTWRDVSLIDGKQPLFIWLVSFFLRFIPDPIIAGRIVSVLAGLASTVGLYLFGRRFFNERIGLLAAMLYVVAPFYLLHDSLAIMDPLSTTLSIYAAYFTLSLAQSFKLKDAVIGGIIVGLGLLTKSSGMFSLYLLPGGLLVMKTITKKSILHYLLKAGIVIVVAFMMESVLRTSIYYATIASKNYEFIRPLSEVMAHPFTHAVSNALLIAEWLGSYVGIPLLLVAFSSLFYGPKRKVLFLFAYFAVPVVAMILFAKLMYPRHFLFMTWPLLIMATVVIDHIRKKGIVLFVLITMFVVATPLYSDYFLLKDFKNAKIPALDRWQFIEGEPSGYGMRELYQFFDTVADKKILILTDKPNGVLTDGIAIRYHKIKEVVVAGGDSITEATIKSYKSLYSPDEIYLVTSWQELPGEIHAEKLQEIERSGERNYNWTVYKLQR